MCHRLLAVVALAGVIASACSPSKNSAGKKNNKAILSGSLADSISYYDDRYHVARILNEKDLQGKWEVATMHRQPDALPEKLKGVTLSFVDSSIAGNMPCNSFVGDFSLKGKTIGFDNIIKTQMACDKIDQEAAFIALLQKQVRSIILEGDRLLLEDGRGHTVFECTKGR